MSMADKLAAALAQAKLALPKVHNVADPQSATGCCAAITRAFKSSILDEAESWTCPKCGMIWKPRLIESVKYWEAHPIISIWR